MAEKPLGQYAKKAGAALKKDPGATVDELAAELGLEHLEVVELLDEYGPDGKHHGAGGGRFVPGPELPAEVG